MSSISPNLTEIVTATLRNRSGALAKNLTANNTLLERLLWNEQEPGTVPLPDFIRLSAEGKAKMKNGRVYLLKE